jgi:hypothetical protein
VEYGFDKNESAGHFTYEFICKRYYREVRVSIKFYFFEGESINDES